MARRLANEEAILGVVFSGVNVAAAIELAKRPENKEKLIVTTVNNFAENYFTCVSGVEKIDEGCLLDYYDQIFCYCQYTYI
ncbi:unnamed protein product [Caenorhabditis bovis]|uniref:Uncharacterized protein n=1 Tax=Caenorhabditis bovis TaxID=2654633 RepID=A0A8S1EAH3_9PELO|nr:unnamed protein product [Caenorhabditis bovis]